MLDYVYPIILKVLWNRIFGVQSSIVCHIDNVNDIVMFVIIAYIAV